MSEVSYLPAHLSIVPNLPIKGIFYIGQHGTSGYASAARGYLFHYFALGIPITWHPLFFDDSKLTDDDVYNVVIKSLIKRKLPSYDMAILHSTPDLWPSFWADHPDKLNNKMVIGYCTWETNRLPAEWVKCINNTVNEVWCPSNYNRESFLDSGVTKEIRVVPHIFLKQELPLRKDIHLKDSSGKELNRNVFTFYTIGEMNARKSIEEMLHVYCKTFKKDEPVRFVVKTHYKNYSPENTEFCEKTIKEILDKYPNHAEVVTLLECMSNNEILALHSLGDCYISLTKSEGFGLTIFDAMNYGKPVIATGFGGQLDFLDATKHGLVRYELGPVTGMKDFSVNYTSDQIWAYPDLNHASELMRKTFDSKKQ